MSASDRVKAWGPTTVCAIVMAALGVWNTLRGGQESREADLREINMLKGQVVSLRADYDDINFRMRDHDKEQRAWLEKLLALDAAVASLAQWTKSTDIRLTDISRDIREIRQQVGIRKPGPADFEGGRGGAQ